MSELEEFNIRISLTGVHAEKFKFLKEKWLGVENNTDVLRVLITRRYRELKNSKKEG